MIKIDASILEEIWRAIFRSEFWSKKQARCLMPTYQHALFDIFILVGDDTASSPSFYDFQRFSTHQLDFIFDGGQKLSSRSISWPKNINMNTRIYQERNFWPTLYFNHVHFRYRTFVSQFSINQTIKKTRDYISAYQYSSLDLMLHFSILLTGLRISWSQFQSSFKAQSFE